jgi:hypothetical protein
MSVREMISAAKFVMGKGYKDSVYSLFFFNSLIPQVERLDTGFPGDWPIARPDSAWAVHPQGTYGRYCRPVSRPINKRYGRSGTPQRS